MNSRILFGGALLAALVMTGCSRGVGSGTAETGTSDESREKVVIETTRVPGTETGGTAATPEDTLQTEEESVYQPRLIVATDLHYLAEKLDYPGSASMETMARGTDGRAVLYSREITDAFLEEVRNQKPDALILCGDLAMDGEKESHEELAGKLLEVEKSGTSVVVIPGNHDINSQDAVGYTEDGTYPAEPASPEDFALIYRDMGYGEAISRDPGSLSYTYRLDDNYWLLMLDTCQYDPVNLVGGAVRDTTYEWLEQQLDNAWSEGVQLIPVTHHNLLDQSGVSKAFYDNCTIEHDEKLIDLLSDYEVMLHLSGHLHMQHAKFLDGDSGLCEVVTASLSMAPFQYGVLDIYDTGNMRYRTAQTDVSAWAGKNGSRDENLLDFRNYGETFLKRNAYDQTYAELSGYARTEEARELGFTEANIDPMSAFYAEVCLYYFSGRMSEVQDELLKDPARKMWSDYGHVSERSDFLNNILEDEAWNFNDVELEF